MIQSLPDALEFCTLILFVAATTSGIRPGRNAHRYGADEALGATELTTL